jgi:predicted ArsR family transcriptional regulator
MTEPKKSSDQPRDEESQRFNPQSTVREILDTFEDNGEKNIPTGDLAEELEYSKHGITHRLRSLSEYVEEENLGQGNPILWSLKYTRRDFLKAFETLGDLTPPEEIAEHVGCSEEVAREWLYKLKDEGELATHTRGEDISPLWSRMPD